MKYAFFTLALCCISSVIAQNETRTEKKFQRYENGVLMEDKYYLEENGRAVQGTDFEMPEMGQMQLDMDAKMAEMQQRMNEMQRKSEEMMRTRMQEMDRRIEEMQQRSLQMQDDMQMKMSSPESIEPSQAPLSTPENVNGASGTLYNL